MQPDYLYKAKVLKVVDGDTLDCEVDLGFRVTTRQRFRLHRIDTPEVRGERRPEGLATTYVVERILGRHWEASATRAKLIKEIGLSETLDCLDKLVERFPTGTEVYIRSVKTGKFGRWLAEMFLVPKGDGDAVNLNDWLVENKLGETYGD